MDQHAAENENENEIAGGVSLTARDPAYRERPHERLDRLRSAAPVFQDRDFDRVMLTRAADVAAMLADRSLSADPLNARPTAFSRRGLTEADRGGFSMLSLDDPDHARLRGLVTQAFTARAIETLRPRIVSIAAELLDAIDPEQPFDLVTAYAAPLPSLIIAAMLGIDEGDITQFKEWAADILSIAASDPSPDSQKRRTAALAGAQDCIRKVLVDRRERPCSDLISALALAEKDGDRLNEREILTTCLLLLLAGHVTTADLIGTATVALLRHPDQLARLRSEPVLWPAAIEEMLRYEPPATTVSRQVPDDREIAGCPVEAGQTITAMLLAANHDPALHPDPHVFDIARANQKHFSFGGGSHFCLGASLARLEMQVAMPALFERFPGLRLTPGRDLRHKANPGFNGYEAVWVATA